MANKIIIGVVIGLVIGLVLGLFINIIFNFPNIISSGAGVNNQVQVSGSIYEANTGKIVFTTLNVKVTSSIPFGDGHYKILLLGNQSYAVSIQDWNGNSWSYTIFVPTGSATFNANF